MEEFMNAEDVACKLKVSRSLAYKIIRNLNQELQEKGYLVISGRVPQQYFLKRYYLNTSDTK